MKLEKVIYSDLKGKQKENYNGMKLGARLADYGFVSMKLSDDYLGADILACHIDHKTILRIQLKGRCSFDKKYMGKDIYIAFRVSDDWYVYPHDEVLSILRGRGRLDGTISWDKKDGYSFPYLTPMLKELLEPYRLV